MKTSYKGRAFLAREEGCVLSAYRDSVGVWTIGIGHTSAAGPPRVEPGLKLSLDECFDLFARDLVKYERGVNRAVKVPLKQHEFDALVSWHYNTGKASKASFIKKLNEGNKAGAILGIMDWKKPAVVIPRRTRERDLLATGNYGDLSGLPVWKTRGGKPSKMKFPSQKPAEPRLPPDVPIPTPRPEPPPATGLSRLLAFMLSLLKSLRRKP